MDTTEEARHINMTIKVLKEQVEVLTSQQKQTGAQQGRDIRTTISILKHRIGELENQGKEHEEIAAAVSQEVIDQVRLIIDPNKAIPGPKEGEELYINWPESESKEDSNDKEKNKVCEFERTAN